MNSNVKVEANRQGELISRSNGNPGWGWIRVVQTRNILNTDTGVVKSIDCSALVMGNVRDLKKLGWEDGMEVEGKIIFKDSMTPFRKNDPNKDHKIAGKTGIICTVEGKPIYRKYLFSPDPKAQDILIEPDAECRESIRIMYERMENGEVISTLDKAPEFDL